MFPASYTIEQALSPSYLPLSCKQLGLGVSALIFLFLFTPPPSQITHVNNLSCSLRLQKVCPLTQSPSEHADLQAIQKSTEKQIIPTAIDL